MEYLGPIHIFVTLFVIFAWSRVFLRFRDDTMNLSGMIFWSLVWLAVLVVLYLPQTTEFLAIKLGIGRGVDVFVYSSVVILFYMVYRVYVKLETIEREITAIVRENALNDLPKKKK